MSNAEDLDRAARRLHRHRAQLLDELEATEAVLREIIEERGNIERPKYLQKPKSIAQEISLTDRVACRPRRKQAICKTCWSNAERLTEPCSKCGLLPKAGT